MIDPNHVVSMGEQFDAEAVAKIRAQFDERGEKP